jgi:hypothetical protein
MSDDLLDKLVQDEDEAILDAIAGIGDYDPVGISIPYTTLSADFYISGPRYTVKFDRL